MKIMTISPNKEAQVGFSRIKHLISIGVRPSLGHDRVATESDILECLKLGSPAFKLHTTHLYNVMSFHHRQPSLINFLLCRKYPRGEKYAGAVPPSVEIIADMIHCHPVAVQNLLTARETADIAIISDCISSYEPGKRLKYNGRGITVQAEGGCYLLDQFGRPTPTLAGSTVTLADEFYTLITHFGVDICAACQMLATTPAKIARIDERVGSLEQGKMANILLLNGELNTITRRMVYGRWIEDQPYRMLRPSVSHM